MTDAVPTLPRRDFLLAGTIATTLAMPHGELDAAEPPLKDPFRYCLNTSTIRGQKLGIVEEINIAAKAGYSGIEPWIDGIEAFMKSGGKLDELRKRIADAGLTVESAIGFAGFLALEEEARHKGLDDAKRAMDLVAAIGGQRIAAPPVGVTEVTNLNLQHAAEHFGALIDLGVRQGVLPQLELWGFSKALSRLGEVAYVAIESGRAEALCLLDVYHIYKGGSSFAGLRLLSGERMQCFHVNDYPADPPRETVNDSHRVYPGDGVAPLNEIFQTLYRAGYRGTLSLELFNRDYWSQDALQVATTGLQKTKAAVAKALGLV